MNTRRTFLDTFDRDALAGGLALAVAMGFGRFAYTALYPLMIRDGIVTLESGSLIASANYAGYLVGALAVGGLSPASSGRMCLWGLVATLACLLGMGLLTGEIAIVALRFTAGIASAVVLVAASVWFLQAKSARAGAPLLYAGVGFGIAVSAEIVAGLTDLAIHSTTLWLVLALIGAAFVAFSGARLLRPTVDGLPTQENAAEPQPRSRRLFGPRTLVLLYGLAGYGYIISATYLPIIVGQAVAAFDPVHFWAAFGVGAIPSCFFWHWFHQRFGTRRALAANFLVQGIGIILPVLTDAPFWLLCGAVLVGGTFMGVVTVAMGAARDMQSALRFNVMAAMTAAYGVGQIVGPLVAGFLAGTTESFDFALASAALALTVGAAVCIAARPKSMALNTA